VNSRFRAVGPPNKSGLQRCALVSRAC
jgi:hypothetical protein